MKPQIAIGMSRAGIDVMHRASDGWRTVGHVALDAPDFSAQVRSLRDRAQGLVRGSLAAKLIIPDTEILYTTVEAPGPDDEARAAQIAAAVDGMTPYAAEDLVFDWCGIGDTLQVAVVARETLQEAEAFASEYGIDAVAFVAAPDDDRFMGEVYFGRTGMAGWLLPPGDSIERDESPVRSIGPVPAPVPKPVLNPRAAASDAASDAAPEAEAKPTETAPEPESGSDANDRKASRKARKAAAARAAAEAEAARKAENEAAKTKAETKPDADSGVKPSASDTGDAAHETPTTAVGEKLPTVDSSAPGAASSDADVPSGEAALAFASRRVPKPAAQELPASSAVPEAASAAAAGVVATPTLLSRFAKVRARLIGRETAEKGADARNPDVQTPDGPAPSASDRLGDKARALLKRRSGSDSARPKPTNGADAAAGDARAPAAAPAPAHKPTDVREKLASAASRPKSPSLSGEGAPELKAALAAPVADLTTTGGRKSQTADAVGTEAEKLTIFGARGHVPAARGFVSRGLLLTGGLLLFLVAIAVWAVYFTSDPTPRSGVSAPTAPPAPTAQQQSEAPVAAPETAEPPQTAADPDRPPIFDEDAQIDATLAGIEDALAEAVEPIDTAPDEAAADPAAPNGEAGPGAGLVLQPAPEGTPGAAGPAEPESGTLRAEAIQTGDEEPIALSALTPPSGTASAMPDPPAAPAPFGTEPVPGAASAPGFEPPPEVTEGRPAVVPPVRPQGLVPDDQSGTNLQAPADDSELVTDVAAATPTAQDGVDPVADTLAAVSGAAAALLDDAASSGPADGEAAPGFALAEVPELPLTEAEALGRGLGVFTEADPQFAAFRPAPRPEGGTVSESGPDADTSAAVEVAAAAPDVSESAPVAPPALADTATAVVQALENSGRDEAPLARSAAEAAAVAQGAALFSDADPALAGTRPSSRPAAVLSTAAAVTAARPPEVDADAVPAATPGAIEIAAQAVDQAADGESTDDTASRAMTATPGGIVLTALRPAARPETLVARPPEPAADPSPPAVESDSPLAVANSLRPSQRPQDFARRVQQAIAAAQAAAPARSAPQQQQQQQQQQQPVQQAAAPARSAAPQIPTAASVAREATQARAINLRQINLLGTFGTSSNRTALVRLSNGRVEQLRVGDRLDRGQVTAIGESELHYVRSGRTHRLRIAERG